MDNSEATRIKLTDDSGLGQLEVDLESFFEFSFWIAEELEDMVAKHTHERRRREQFGRRSVRGQSPQS